MSSQAAMGGVGQLRGGVEAAMGGLGQLRRGFTRGEPGHLGHQLAQPG